MKICYDCKLEKPFSEFAVNRRRKDGFNGQCKSCKREYTRKHYQDNLDYYITKAAKNKNKYKQEIRDIIVKHFDKNPCIDCGNSDIRVLEFDHRDGVEKLDGVGALINSGRPINEVKHEIAKCDVRCCNCHRIRTAKQFGWWTDTV